jgi:pentatricopeptide repeat protein
MPARDVVSWSSLILGHVKCGEAEKALELFQQMQREKVNPNPVTFVGVVNACASMLAFDMGRHVHEQIIKCGHESNIFVANSLIDMYAKCGSIEDAEKVFNNMPTHDLVSWNAMIMGQGSCGHGLKALELFPQMQQEGMEPNPITFVGLLNACASVAALEKGRHIHEQIIQFGCEDDLFVANSLIDMYAKCGNIEDAQRVFNRMPMHNVVSWTVMLQGHAMHGHGKQALEHFEQVCQESVDIDHVTFVCLLSACSHAGLVDEGIRQFDSMGLVYSISASAEHYVCMVDLLGRAGHMQEAEDLIKTMPFEPHVAVWKALLGALPDEGCWVCARYKGVEEEEKVFHLCHHSEKLAISFGLISTTPGSPLHISKNLRVCCNCHTSTKFITKDSGESNHCNGCQLLPLI